MSPPRPGQRKTAMSFASLDFQTSRAIRSSRKRNADFSPRPSHPLPVGLGPRSSRQHRGQRTKVVWLDESDCSVDHGFQTQAALSRNGRNPSYDDPEVSLAQRMRARRESKRWNRGGTPSRSSLRHTSGIEPAEGIDQEEKEEGEFSSVLPANHDRRELMRIYILINSRRS